MPKLVRLLTFVALFGLVLCAAPTHAQGLLDAGGKLTNAGTKTDLPSDFYGTVSLVAKGLLGTLGAIFLILMVYSGMLWMTANGKEEQIETARKILTATIIGLFITLSAYGITTFVFNRIGVATVPASK